jgi:hypothetical protein
LTDHSTCFISLFEIPFAFSCDVSKGCIHNALCHQGFNRCYAHLEPLLNTKHCREHLKWAQEKLDWDTLKWQSIFWTDKTSMQCLAQARGYDTRCRGKEHNLDCIEPKFKIVAQCRFWACISGLKHKGLSFNFYFCF